MWYNNHQNLKHPNVKQAKMSWGIQLKIFFDYKSYFFSLKFII